MALSEDGACGCKDCAKHHNTTQTIQELTTKYLAETIPLLATLSGIDTRLIESISDHSKFDFTCMKQDNDYRFKFSTSGDLRREFRVDLSGNSFPFVDDCRHIKDILADSFSMETLVTNTGSAPCIDPHRCFNKCKLDKKNFYKAFCKVIEDKISRKLLDYNNLDVHYKVQVLMLSDITTKDTENDEVFRLKQCIDGLGVTFMNVPESLKRDIAKYFAQIWVSDIQAFEPIFLKEIYLLFAEDVPTDSTLMAFSNIQPLTLLASSLEHIVINV